jgi:DNA-binding CsgD family transcriptional regulator
VTAATDALTDKEKATLRLIVRGHDAKSCARHLGLSVHTINERLREARRKLGVSSSREAARLLQDEEEGAPEKLGDEALGDDSRRGEGASVPLPTRSGRGPQFAMLAGGTTMLVTIAALVLAPGAQPSSQVASPALAAATQTEATASALRWLALVDASRWQESWAATGATFRKANTVDAWRSASEQARVPLGAVISRVPNGEESVPAPPAGYMMVRFRTTFANGGEIKETLSLVREGAEWRVVGYMLG